MKALLAFLFTAALCFSQKQPLCYTYSANTGSAYQCVLTNNETPADGLLISFKADITNVGASTLSINGNSWPIMKQSGQLPLAAGDLPAGQWVSMLFNGSNWSAMLPGAGTIDITSATQTGKNRFSLINWRTALAKVMNGTADAKILAVGDSTTWGMGCDTRLTSAPLCSWPARLASILNGRGIPAANGMGDAYYNEEGATAGDNRWTVGTGWSLYAYGFGSNGPSALGGDYGTQNNGSATLTYTPGDGYSYDRFDIYYLENTTSPAFGKLSATATGGTAGSVTPIGSGIGYFTVAAGSASTSNSVTMTCPITAGTSNSCHVIGVEPWLSTKTRVRIANVGVPGARSDDWTTTSVYGSLPAIAAYAPNLTIISLGINNVLQGRSPALTVSDLTTLITFCKTYGDVILLGSLPSGQGSAPGESALIQPYKVLAAQMGIPFVDIFDSVNGTYQPSLMYATDLVHYQSTGYWDVAFTLDSFLASISN